MERFRDTFLNPSSRLDRNRTSIPRSLNGVDPCPESTDFRQFVFHPVAGPNKQAFGSQAQYRAGWEDDSVLDPNAAARVMVDNWLLFGLDELNGGRPVFLDCTRDTLMSGFLWLLPARSAVFNIPGSLEPDAQVLAMCRSLKAAGYRFALDDFNSPANMHEFLDVADFIKADFRHAGRRERACMLRRLGLTGAALVAGNISSEEEFHAALEEGFGLVQGYFFGERVSFVKKRDLIDPIRCTRILECLHEPEHRVVGELADLIDAESGIQCRLLRRANWVTPPEVVINSTRDALDAVEAADVHRLITLAMSAACLKTVKPRRADHKAFFIAAGADPFVRSLAFSQSIDPYARARW